jgi:hypothetical protein
VLCSVRCIYAIRMAALSLVLGLRVPSIWEPTAQSPPVSITSRYFDPLRTEAVNTESS